jgi:PhnB protein
MIAEKGRATDEARIRKLRDDLTAAIRAKDADGLISHFAAESVMFVLSPPLQFKADEGPGKEGIKQWFDTFQGPIGYEVRDLKITTGDTVAFCHSLNRISGDRSGGENTDIWVRETLGLRKIDGQWKITHQHQSVPFYMDGSNKAAIDLKP